ncbi:hypothetical protein [Pseudomonas mandelii]|uniref:hypothetical protein n=1 Tax=Pseudomonas mandelii TaxID=75612 RepID=UPI00224ACD94|nr:hypothetical protein [Pseudomonas mandelii]MCX2898765.1 hypothetical protein [Pseudomonas mandelii]
MIDQWSPWIAVVVIAGPYFLVIVSIGFSFYISQRHLDAMLEALPNSRHVLIWGAGLRYQGSFARLMLVAKLGGVVLWSGPCVRAGEMDAGDLKNFPPDLKRLLQVKLVLTIVIVIWMALGYVLVM